MTIDEATQAVNDSLSHLKQTMNEYECIDCKTAGVRLWRVYTQSVANLRCARCTERHEGVEIDYNDNLCGRSVPAIPVTGETRNFHRYLSTPVDRLQWWASLPLTK